jgi:hypothetical protein
MYVKVPVDFDGIKEETGLSKNKMQSICGVHESAFRRMKRENWLHYDTACRLAVHLQGFPQAEQSVGGYVPERILVKRSGQPKAPEDSFLQEYGQIGPAQLFVSHGDGTAPSVETRWIAIEEDKGSVGKFLHAVEKARFLQEARNKFNKELAKIKE